MSGLTVNRFTASGSWVTPSGITNVVLYGRGADATNDTDFMAFPFKATPGTTYTVTITSSLTRVLDGSTTIVTFANGSNTTVSDGAVSIQWID